MLVITDAEARRFADSLTERKYSPATINKYVHDLRLLMDYAPDGITHKRQFHPRRGQRVF